MNNNFKNLLLVILIAFSASSCRKEKDNFDIDLSDFKVQNNSPVKVLTSESSDSSEIKNELKTYQNKSDILNSIKLGKIDPFSEGEINLNNLTSDFQLTGILSTKINKYAFVSYLGREGTINSGSIGGVNTFLLPNGAKVININTKSLKLIINFENKDYIFEL